tara:strand:+ start:42 stop:1337 length:1296 start_codon:yes stop_codon:yes gene_type:complete
MKKKQKEIAIIGGGPMGLAIAYQLTLKGFKPVIYEADNRLGGMTACFNFEGLDIERFYHFHCLSDFEFIKILQEIGLMKYLKWKETKMGFYYDKKLYKWGSIDAVIRFDKIPLLTRIRYLCHAARCLTIRNWNHLDKITAVEWLKKWLGKSGYYKLWHKLFEYKFYHFSNEISAAWIWSRINRLGKSRKNLKEKLGYLEGGSKQLINRLAKIISEKGTLINLSTPVLGINPRKDSGANITTSLGCKEYDLVISTIPLPLVGEIFRHSGIDQKITSKYECLDCVACACVIFKTRKKITDNFWTNINDKKFNIPGIVEISNLREFNHHITYVPFYMPETHDEYLLENKHFINKAWDCLKLINPDLNDSDLITSHCSRYRFAQPVCSTNYQKKLPPKQPFKGVYTVDTNFYYPEDRGINESFSFGRNLVDQLFP